MNLRKLIPQFPTTKLKKRLQEQEEKFGSVLEAIQIQNANLMLRLQDDTTQSNNYQTHSAQTDELKNMYIGATDIGCDLAKRLVNISAALQVPNGVGLEYDPKDEKSQEVAYIKKFLEVNQLNEGVCTFLTREAQIEGQVLVQLIWDENVNVPLTSYLKWSEYKYSVFPIGKNNMIGPYQVGWEKVEDKDSEGQTLVDPDIAWAGFNKVKNVGGSIEGYPSLGNVLMRLDAIGRDLYDWRISNKLYAYPTPHVSIEDGAQAEELASKIKALGWTVGNMLVTSGKFEMVVPENFYQTIKESIVMSLQFISGSIGLAVSWLGFPDLMSNRATADSLGEPLEIVAAADITEWRSFYQQMFNNVITIRNANMVGKPPLKMDVVKPKIRPMSDRIWQQLIRLYLPAAEQNILSREGFLNKIPGFNVEEEVKRMEKQIKEGPPINPQSYNRDTRSDQGQASTGSQKDNERSHDR